MTEGTHMTRQISRMSVVLLCMGLLAAMLAGCFGGSEGQTATTSNTTLPTSDTTTATVLVTTTESSTLVGGLPRQYVASLGTRPIVVLFYAPGGVEDEKVLSSVRQLQTTYSSYTFLTFDYRMPAAYGDLSEELAIKGLPQVVLIDRHGATQRVWSGYVDTVSLNQTLLTLGRY